MQASNALQGRRCPRSRPPPCAPIAANASKARAHLGWDRRLRLAEALDWTGAWYRAQEEGADAAALTLDQIARYEALAGAEDRA